MALDLAGQRFGRLVVVEQAGHRNGVSLWRCLCQCGGSKEVTRLHLRSGGTQSCGCLQRERAAEASSREVVGYTGAHRRVYKSRGPAREQACVDCSSQAEDWSYAGGDPDELTALKGGYLLPFSLNPAFYVPRCRTCHHAHDHHATTEVSA